ncbi:MAG: DUF924 domain-containing protein [Nitrospinae bacterium]|nr:DUF924 domain-containing protein [Nitrospinota bacterium]
MTDEVLSYWFGDDISYDHAPSIVDRIKNVWFAGSDDVDNEIRKRFADDIAGVTEETLSQLNSSRDKLAVIILLDQFPRNIFRESSEAFAKDHMALKLAKELIRSNEDVELEPIQRVFVYLALEHAENVEDQSLSVKKYEELLEEVDEGLKSIYESFLEYAIRHKVIIDRFGRFPHRNEILGRESTKEEIEFLKQPGSSF